MARQNNVLITGETYRYDMDVVGTAGINLRINNGNANGDAIAVVFTAQTGHKSGSFVAVGPHFSLEADAAAFTGTVDNVTAVTSGGEYVLTGTPATLTVGVSSQTMVADPGVYSLTGTAAGLARQFTLVATPGIYAYTEGVPPAISVARRIPVDAGSYALTGTNANLLHGWTMPATPGSYALTGEPVGFSKGYAMSVDAGSYTMTGVATAFGRTYQIDASAGSYALTGVDAAFAVGMIMPVEAGSYAYDGYDVAFRYMRLSAAPGGYTITGWPVSFSLGDLADLVPAPDPVIVFRHQEPDLVRVPKLNQLATIAAVKRQTVLSMAELATISPEMGLQTHVWDAPGGYAPAYGDGFNWRKMSDGTVLI
jgi:hypothetical protein